jgi:eukaryotic-like serine/threonine-protein kinase
VRSCEEQESCLASSRPKRRRPPCLGHPAARPGHHAARQLVAHFRPRRLGPFIAWGLGPTMSQRFVRCSQCGLPHGAAQILCPSTGRIAFPGRTGSLAPPAPPAPPMREQPPRKQSPRRELVGRVVAGKYRLRRLLGAGGVGTVFEAEHLLVGRLVAIKVLHSAYARKVEAVQRFKREARAAGCIRHPNVCEVYDLDTLDDDSPFLVMELLVGETLSRRLAAVGRLPLYELIDILLQLLSALSAAHDKGIVHRDIKPENVFLTRPVGCLPAAKLFDFGVSKTVRTRQDPLQGECDLTRKGMVMGTPYCMSPEQARGDRDLDARVDLYACGVVLYQALTGRRPFVAETNQAVLREVLRGKARPARELRPALPRGFDEILAKAMALNRDDRYRSADEFRRALLRIRPPNRLLGLSSPSSSFVPDADEQPTRAWVSPRELAQSDDVAPTRFMRRRPQRVSPDDPETIVRRRPSA